MKIDDIRGTPPLNIKSSDFLMRKPSAGRKPIAGKRNWAYIAFGLCKVRPSQTLLMDLGNGCTNTEGTASSPKSRFSMIDFQKLKQIYKLSNDLSFSDIQNLLKSAKAVSYAPGELLVEEGQLKKEVFWIRKGLVRGFRITEKGEEVTTMLRWEDQPVACQNLMNLALTHTTGKF